MKLLHAADLHIDSPLRGLQAYPDAPVDLIRAASRRATENLVSLALAEAVDGVLLAGDIYDGEWRDFETGLYFQRQMLRLQEADIPVYLVSGNHDAASQISRSLSLPANVHRFGTHEPETRIDETRGLAVHGQGYVRRDVDENLAAGYPPALSGLFNVGLLHTALTGREGHDTYAPCTVEQLAAHGYGYWALGHVHKREEVSREPYIVFPGNIQGRHAKETGPKGASLVSVEPGRVHVEHRELDVVRWEQVVVDTSDARDLDDTIESVRAGLNGAKAAAGGRMLAARVRLTGAGPVHTRLWRERERLLHEVRTVAFDLGEVWVEKVRIETSPGGDGHGPAGPELLSGLAEAAARLGDDGERLRELIKRDPLWSKLPQQARGRDRLDIEDDSWCRQLLGEASDLLASMLEERD